MAGWGAVRTGGERHGEAVLGEVGSEKVGNGVKRSDRARRYGVRHSSTVQGSERRGGTRLGTHWCDGVSSGVAVHGTKHRDVE